jgi:transposase
MAKTFRTYLPEQNLLLPASLREWLPDDHLSYFVSDVVDQLDLSAIESVYEGEERGQPPYHPRMMTKILLYGYCVGVFSSRKIQKRLVEDIAFRVLAAGNQPDFRTISDFRKLHLKALEELSADVTADVRDRDDEVGSGGTGREQGEGQREQAQSHELRADEGNREAIEGGSSEVVEASRGGGPRRG